MQPLFRRLSAALFLLSLIALALLLGADVWAPLRLAAAAWRPGALALMLAGAAFVGVQLGTSAQTGIALKDLLLGLAFVLWGAEQYLPAGWAVTAIDAAVITIFVVDLGVVIRRRLAGGRLEATPSSLP
jgi:hypothetical protein